jgi:hypothetical protein
MKIDLVKEFEFIPEWNDNQEDENPIKFVFRHLTAGEVDSIVSLDGKYDTSRVFKLSTLRIENLEVNGEKITTADKLLGSPGLAPLMYEAIGYLLKNMNPVSNPKN